MPRARRPPQQRTCRQEHEIDPRTTDLSSARREKDSQRNYESHAHDVSSRRRNRSNHGGRPSTLNSSLLSSGSSSSAPNSTFHSEVCSPGDNGLRLSANIFSQLSKRLTTCEERTEVCPADPRTSNVNSGNSAGTLDLSRLGIDDASLAPLFDILNDQDPDLLAQIHSVCFSINPLSHFGIAELLQFYLPQHFGHITSLDIFQVGFDEHCVPSLISAIDSEGPLPNIVKLKLGDNLLASTGADALTEGLLRCRRPTLSNGPANSVLQKADYLQQVHLGGNPLGDAGVASVGRLVAPTSPHHLTHLGLRDVKMGSEGAIALARFLVGNAYLTELQLRENSLGPVGIQAVAESIATMTSLTTLDVKSVGMDDAASARLFAALSQSPSQLRNVDVSQNTVLHRGSAALKTFLAKASSLTSLNAEQCGLTDGHLTTVLQGLHANVVNGSSLSTLILSGNNAAYTDFTPLADSLRHSSCALLTLELAACHINDKGTKTICKSLTTSGGVRLKHLTLSQNFACSQGAVAIADMVRENRSLVRVRINDNHLIAASVRLIAKALETNIHSSIREFVLGGQSKVPPLANELDPELRKQLKSIIDSRISEFKHRRQSEWTVVGSSATDSTVPSMTPSRRSSSVASSIAPLQPSQLEQILNDGPATNQLQATPERGPCWKVVGSSSAQSSMCSPEHAMSGNASSYTPWTSQPPSLRDSPNTSNRWSPPPPIMCATSPLHLAQAGPGFLESVTSPFEMPSLSLNQIQEKADGEDGSSVWSQQALG